MESRNDRQHYFIQYILLFVGLYVMSFGIAMYLKAGLGANPLTTFTNGFAKTFNMSVGHSSQLIMFVTMFVIYFIDKNRIGIGTITNAIFTGLFINHFMKFDFTSIHSNILLTIGIVTFSIGLGMYVMADLGEGAIDAFMIILQDNFNINIKTARIILDLVLVLLGIILGGGFGIGTVLGTALTGTIMAKTMTIIKKYKKLNGGNINGRKK